MSASFESKDQINRFGLLNLYVVYVVWGSTYLAIRIAAREGSGFPPMMIGLTRVLVAALILFGLAKLKGWRLRPSRSEIIVLAISGILLWTGGNGLVVWAEQHADSGLAALIISATPIWTALIESAFDRKLPSLRLVGSLVIGFAGIAALSLPSLRSGSAGDVWAIIALLAAAVSWGSGTVLQSRRPVNLRARVSSAYQHLFGGLGFLVVLMMIPEPLPAPTTEAWLAWGYLVLVGSVLAFTSYVTALRLLPVSVVMTYAYVNPVIAVVLGAVVLGEPITIWTLAGASMVLLGVAGIFRERYGAPRREEIVSPARG